MASLVSDSFVLVEVVEVEGSDVVNGADSMVSESVRVLRKANRAYAADLQYR